MGDLEAWPSITWTVLSGPEAVLLGQWLCGNLEHRTSELY